MDDNVRCKGDWSLGTACGECTKCKDSALAWAKRTQEIRRARATSEPINTHVVNSNDGKELVDKAIAMPLALSSPDERQYRIRQWEPSVSVGEVVSVKIEAIVELESN